MKYFSPVRQFLHRLAIPRVGKRAAKDIITKLKDAQDDVENIEDVKNTRFDDGNMTNAMNDPKLKDFLASWQYKLFLNKNKFLLFRV